ncbi:Lipase 3, partial [Melipona quadrifasciata]
SYSWHEIGIYDLPAMIDHIIEQTKQEKIFMVTHSQGGAAFFVMASERPEYQEKVIAFSALAPAVFMSRTGTSLFRMLCLSLQLTLNLLGIYQFKPLGTFLRTLGKIVCSEQSLLLPVCKGVFDLAFGYDGNLNASTLRLVSQYAPAGASIRQFAHYGQSILSG